jgi:hypothetical protein
MYDCYTHMANDGGGGGRGGGGFRRGGSFLLTRCLTVLLFYLHTFEDIVVKPSLKLYLYKLGYCGFLLFSKAAKVQGGGGQGGGGVRGGGVDPPPLYRRIFCHMCVCKHFKTETSN